MAAIKMAAISMDQRNATIVRLYQRGWTYKRIAERYGLTVHRINQILAASRCKRTRKAA